jgi:hypothetical protein
VNRDQSSAAFHVTLERRFELGRPALVGRVVVQDDDSVGREIRRELREVAAGRRRRDRAHIEKIDLAEDALEHGCDAGPVVTDRRLPSRINTGSGSAARAASA